MGGRSMKDVGGAVLAGSTPPFLGRERAAVDVDVGPERRSPRYHETDLALESIKDFLMRERFWGKAKKKLAEKWSARFYYFTRKFRCFRLARVPRDDGQVRGAAGGDFARGRVGLYGSPGVRDSRVSFTATIHPSDAATSSG